MRKILTIFMAAVLVMTMGLCVPMSAETVSPFNGDFEAENPAEGWMYEQGKLVEPVNIVSEGENNYALLKNSDGTRGLLFSSYVPVEAGVEYAVDFDYKSAKSWRMYIQWFDNGGESIAPETYAYFAANDAWSHGLLDNPMTGSCTAPAEAGMARILIDACNKFDSEEDGLRIDNIVFAEKKAGANIVANGNMEAVTDNLPSGFTFSGGTAGTNYAIATNEKHGGANSVKLTGVEGGAVTMSYTFDATRVQYDIAAYMNLTECSGTGVMLKVSNADTGNQVAATSYFTQTGKGWRKMMLCQGMNAAANASLRIDIILTGAGTVYIDDISVNETTDAIRNGDLEGLSSDTKFAGTFSAGVASTENGNTFVSLGTGAGHSQQAITRAKSYPAAGTMYKLTFDYKGYSYGPAVTISGCITANSGYLVLPGSPNSGKAADGTIIDGDWYRGYTVYFTVTSAMANGYTMGFYSRNNTTAAYFDNIKLEVVTKQDSLAVYQDGEKTIELQGGEGKKATVRYQGYAEKGEGSATLIAVRYKKTANGLQLDQVFVKDGIWETKGYGVYNADPSGEAPMVLEQEIDIPGEGYVVKGFVGKSAAEFFSNPFMSACKAES